MFRRVYIVLFSLVLAWPVAGFACTSEHTKAPAPHAAYGLTVPGHGVAVKDKSSRDISQRCCHGQTHSRGKKQPSPSSVPCDCLCRTTGAPVFTLPVTEMLYAAGPAGGSRKIGLLYKETYFSSGYCFVWLPPKIG